MSWLVALFAWLWVLAALAALAGSYWGVSFSYALSFAVEDGWCDTSTDGIGRHCFGDFGLPFYVGGSPGEVPSHGYTEGNINGTNTPMVVLFFQVFNFLPYRILLIATLLAYLGSMLWLMLYATRDIPAGTRSVTVVFGGLLSVGLLVGIDRANHVVLMAPLLGLLLVARTPFWRIFAMTLLICLKFWGVIFIIVLLKRRRYKEAALAAILAGVLSAGALVLATGNLLSSFSSMVRMVTSREVADMVTPYSVSFIATLRKASCLMPESGLCPVDASSGSLAVLATSVSIMVILVIVAWVSLGKETWSPFVRFAPLVGIVVLGLPEAGVYVLVLVPVLTALLALDARKESNVGEQPVWLSVSLIGAIALTTVPVSAFWVLNVDGSEFLLRWQYLISPLAWTVFLATMVVALVKSRCGQTTSTESVSGGLDEQFGQSVSR
jgi:hypothetical protein